MIFEIVDCTESNQCGSIRFAAYKVKSIFIARIEIGDSPSGNQSANCFNEIGERQRHHRQRP